MSLLYVFFPELVVPHLLIFYAESSSTDSAELIPIEDLFRPVSSLMVFCLSLSRRKLGRTLGSVSHVNSLFAPSALFGLS